MKEGKFRIDETRTNKDALKLARKERDNILVLFQKKKVYFDYLDAYFAKVKFDDSPLSQLTFEKARKYKSELLDYRNAVKKKLEALGRTEQIRWNPEGRKVVPDNASNTYSISTPEGEVLTSSIGQMQASLIWGSEYSFDHRSPPTVQMMLLFIQAAEYIRIRVDLVCSLLESINWQNRGGAKAKGEAYDTSSDILEDPYELWPAGWIAEKLVYSLLNRVGCDYMEDNEFELMVAPIELDIDKKIDFFIMSEQRGIHGIQFVSTNKPEVLERKEKQLQSARANIAFAGIGIPIKSLSLVVVDMSSMDLKGLYREWKNKQKYLVGGPDELLSLEVRKEIVEKCLRIVLSEDRAREIALRLI